MASAGGDWKDMFNAATRGDAACVAYHLHEGADVDYQHPEVMMSALVTAASHGHLEVVELLLEHGADPNLPAELGPLTPLQAARQHQHHDVEALLRRHGARSQALGTTPWWLRWLPGL